MWCFLFAVEFLFFSWKQLWDSSRVKVALHVGGKFALCLKVSTEFKNEVVPGWCQAVKGSWDCFNKVVRDPHHSLCSFRHWLCNTGDRGPSKRVLHHYPGMGHFLPEQLLHHRAPLGYLWAWVEHRYGPQGGSLCRSCWGTRDWGYALVLDINPGLLTWIQIPLKLEISSALGLVALAQ